MNKQVLQIVAAAPGWRALYDSSRQDPIAVWALVETEDGKEVQGYVGGEFMESAEVFDGFLAYLAPGQE